MRLDNGLYDCKAETRAMGLGCIKSFGQPGSVRELKTWAVVHNPDDQFPGFLGYPNRHMASAGMAGRRAARTAPRYSRVASICVRTRSC